MTNAFGMGPLGLGSLSSMLESVELLKKAWSGFSLPASLAPTMDLDELDKRIADLKTVEQWLSMNLSLLRGTVQGMEIQRGTVAALKAFGASMGSEDVARGAFAAAAQAAASAARASAAGADAGAAGGGAAGQRSAETAGAATDAAADGARGASGAAAETGDPSAAAAELTRAAAEAVNPATWWNLLQTQFAQVAQSAMDAAGKAAAKDDSRGTAPEPAPAAPRARRKPRAATVQASAAPPEEAAASKPARRPARAGRQQPPAAPAPAGGRTRR